MEFESLSEEVRQEARRVVAAFGVDQWKDITAKEECTLRDFEGYSKEFFVEWCLYNYESSLEWVNVSHPQSNTSAYYSVGNTHAWHSDELPVLNELLARGLYCLGIDDEKVLAPLPSLTTHEKLELRLSMPREFWPRNWLDEEANS